MTEATLPGKIVMIGLFVGVAGVWVEIFGYNGYYLVVHGMIGICTLGFIVLFAQYAIRRYCEEEGVEPAR